MLHLLHSWKGKHASKLKNDDSSSQDQLFRFCNSFSLSLTLPTNAHKCVPSLIIVKGSNISKFMYLTEVMVQLYMI